MWGKICLFVAYLLLSSLYPRTAYCSAGNSAFFESRYIIDMPNAGILPKGAFSAYTVAYPDGGIMAELSAAPFTNFNMAISYSGTNIIGTGAVSWQNIPSIHLRYRIIDETVDLPAFLIGLNTQGRGNYIKNEKRFQTLSPGFFIAASKNFSWLLGQVSFHSGLNYSFEPLPKKRVPNFYIGLEHSIGNVVSLNFEYNSTFDDSNLDYMKQKGLLNASLRWSITQGFTIELQARDLLEHITSGRGFSRSISLEYNNEF